MQPFMCTNYTKGHITRFSGVVMSCHLTCTAVFVSSSFFCQHLNQSTVRDVQWSSSRLRALLVTPGKINFSVLFYFIIIIVLSSFPPFFVIRLFVEQKNITIQAQFRDLYLRGKKEKNRKKRAAILKLYISKRNNVSVLLPVIHSCVCIAYWLANEICSRALVIVVALMF